MTRLVLRAGQESAGVATLGLVRREQTIQRRKVFHIAMVTSKGRARTVGALDHLAANVEPAGLRQSDRLFAIAGGILGGHYEDEREEQ